MIRPLKFLLVIVCFTSLILLKPTAILAKQTTQWSMVLACPVNENTLKCSQPVSYLEKTIYTYNPLIDPFNLESLETNINPNSSAKIETIIESKDTNPMTFPTQPTKTPPSPTPLPTSIPTPKPTLKPINNLVPNIVVEVPKPTETPANGGLNAEVIFNMINQHRSKKGLPPFEKNDELCQIASSRAPELYNEIFVSGNMHAGFKRRNLSYWATENMISQQNEAAAVNWWLNSSVHRQAIESDRKYSCIACSGNSCAQIFTNFQPK